MKYSPIINTYVQDKEAAKMREDSRNIGNVCPEHAPRPDAKLIEGKEAADFIGKYVKAPFKSKSGKLEHMWIDVRSVEDGKLVGLLNSDPVLDHGGLECDSEVTVELTQIEEVLS